MNYRRVTGPGWKATEVHVNHAFTVSGYGPQYVTYWKLPDFCFSFGPSLTPVLLSVITYWSVLCPLGFLTT